MDFISAELQDLHFVSVKLQDQNHISLPQDADSLCKEQ